MSNAPESAVQPATYVLPDGFTVQDLAAPDYVRPLAEAAAPMIDHCQRLLVAIARPDFDGGLELDCTKNNAMTWLDDFFETVARYEEGRVPFAAAADLLALTERLLTAEMRRYPRLRGDIQSIGQAFRRSFALWGRVLPQPRRSRKVYLRKIFASFDKIVDAICTFNSRLFTSDAPPASTSQNKPPAKIRPSQPRRITYTDRQAKEILEFVEKPEYETYREYLGKSCYDVAKAASDWMLVTHSRGLPKSKEEFQRAYKTLTQRRRRRGKHG